MDNNGELLWSRRYYGSQVTGRGAANGILYEIMDGWIIARDTAYENIIWSKNMRSAGWVDGVTIANGRLFTVDNVYDEEAKSWDRYLSAWENAR